MENIRIRKKLFAPKATYGNKRQLCFVQVVCLPQLQQGAVCQSGKPLQGTTHRRRTAPLRCKQACQQRLFIALVLLA